MLLESIRFVNSIRANYNIELRLNGVPIEFTMRSI